jgi:rod shape-determining protein MreC
MSRRTGRSRLTLILLVLTSVTILTLDFRGSSAISGLRSGASRVFSPVRSGADRVFSPVADAWNGVFDYNDVKSENDKLRAERDAALGAAAQNQDAEKQLLALSALDGVSQWSQVPTVTARVTAGPLTNFEHTIELDKGEGSGIKVGMPVVTGAGLVGRVTAVQGNHSVVKLITDPDLVIGVRLNTSQEVGLAHGQGEGRPLVIDEGIGPKVDIPPNELVTTSGQDRDIFPPAVPVGHVTDSELSANQLVKVATVEPLVDFNQLTAVKVLLWEPAP